MLITLVFQDFFFGKLKNRTSRPWPQNQKKRLPVKIHVRTLVKQNGDTRHLAFELIYLQRFFSFLFFLFYFFSRLHVRITGNIHMSE